VHARGSRDSHAFPNARDNVRGTRDTRPIRTHDEGRKEMRREGEEGETERLRASDEGDRNFLSRMISLCRGEQRIKGFRCAFFEAGGSLSAAASARSAPRFRLIGFVIIRTARWPRR
jgi:hypothetical protein